MSIKLKFIGWFLLATLVPLIIVFFLTTHQTRVHFLNYSKNIMQQTSQHMAINFANKLADLESSIKTVVESSEYQQFKLLQQDRILPSQPFFAEEIIKSLNLNIKRLIIFHNDGVVLTYNEWPTLAGKKPLESQIITGTKQTRLFVGKFTSLANDSDMVVRFVRDGEMVLASGFELQEEFLANQQKLEGLNIYLVINSIDTNQPVRLYPDNNQIRSLLPRTTPDEDMEDVVEFENQTVLLMSRQLTRSADVSVSLFMSYSLQDLHESIHATTYLFSIVAGSFVILSIIAGLIVSRRFSNPLRKLMYGFELIALGDFTNQLSGSRIKELNELLAAYNRMADDLEKLRQQLIRTERVAAWQDIARKIAHEIKNPLSPIQISIETLRKVWDRQHPDFENIFKESSITILEEVEKIRIIVQEFSDFARMPEPEFKVVNLHEIVEKVINLFQPQMKNLNLIQQITEVPPVNADPDQLHRALVNIVTNSLDALNNSGELKITLRVITNQTTRFRKKRPDKILLSIEDNGPGISDEDLKNVFTPYFTTKDRGTGLGLVIVQKIIEQHKGRLNLTSQPGKGTRVDIILPTAKV